MAKVDVANSDSVEGVESGWEKYLSFGGTVGWKKNIGEFTLYVGQDGHGYYSALEYKNEFIFNERRHWRHNLIGAKACAHGRYMEATEGTLVMVGVGEEGIFSK